MNDRGTVFTTAECTGYLKEDNISPITTGVPWWSSRTIEQYCFYCIENLDI